jgi:predicted transposase/invertase (TIGR01784 family)
MVYPLQDRYISLLTDFGFKRVFGTELNKPLLIDFLNTLLPAHHRIQDLTFKNNENLGQTPIDRKAIFDIYCQSISGERFIVEIQKAKQNFFKDRSVYYSTFPIQEQSLKGEWNYELTSVYTVGVLDFVFDDHKNEDTLLHIVELKNQHCEVFYEKLKFIYIELPKFTKSLGELETHLDKWLFLLKHLAELNDPPSPLQEAVFTELFEVAEIANFSPLEQETYQSSLKYYRDMNNVVDTSREEGRKEGRQEGLEEGRQIGIEEGQQVGRLAERSLILDRQRTLLLRLLARIAGELPADLKAQINLLSLEKLEALNEVFLDFTGLEDLVSWLRNCQD